MQFILPTLVSEICYSLGLARSQCQDRDYSWDYPLVSDYPGLVSDLLLPPSMQFILPTLVSEIYYSLGLARSRSPHVSAPADLWSYGQDGRVSVVFESGTAKADVILVGSEFDLDPYRGHTLKHFLTNTLPPCADTGNHSAVGPVIVTVIKPLSFG